VQLARDADGRKRLSLGTASSIGVALVIAATAAMVHVPWQLTARANVAELNSRLNAVVIHSIADKVNAVLDDAVAVRRSVASALGGTMVVGTNDAQPSVLFLTILRSQPNVSSIEFGRPNGQSFKVERNTERSIRLEETRVESDGLVQQTDIYHFDENGDLAFDRSTSRSSDYRVTEQLWYLTAFDRDRVPWSNIYRLSGGGPGVTTSEPVLHNGKLIGALGVSISLDRLSDFLNDIEVSPHGSVFITNIYGELVATQKRMRGTAQTPNEPRGVPRLGGSDMPAARAAWQALGANGVNLANFKGTRQLVAIEANGRFFVTFTRLPQMGLVACVVIPESDILGAINRSTRLLAIALAVAIPLIAIGAAFVARRAIGDPLARVTKNIEQLEEFRLDRIAPVQSRLSEVRQVSAATLRMGTSLASFAKYIPMDLVRELFAQGIEAELGGDHRELTIFFMDLANFTQMSEKLGNRLIDFLARYLAAMSAEIQMEQGTIDKYIGDAIMAFWGAPVWQANHAEAACRAALACSARLDRLRRSLGADAAEELHIRIGLNTGTVLVGNVGSRDRLNYTAIGDPVNVASRLEALNKLYGTEIIIGEATYDAARAHIVARPLDRVAVYGKETGIETYELLGIRSAADAELMASLTLYERGHTALRSRNWSEAIALFDAVIARRGKDRVAQIMKARAEAFKSAPPPAEWDGLLVMESK
jgi:adenylate cyclase